MLTKVIVVIILQYILISNLDAVHLKLIQRYIVNYITIKLEK